APRARRRLRLHHADSADGPDAGPLRPAHRRAPHARPGRSHFTRRRVHGAVMADEEVGGWRTEDGRFEEQNPKNHPPSALHPPSSTGLAPATASTLAYLAGPFSGVLILLAEHTNGDVRFHAWQSIVGLGGLTVAVLASYALGVVAIFISATAVSVMFGV